MCCDIKITSLNIEGFSFAKEILLNSVCNKIECDVLVLQETHRGETRNRPKIDDMNLVLERPHDKYGSAIFCKPHITVTSAALTCSDDIEILSIEIQSCIITSVYKPPNADFKFIEPSNFRNQVNKIIIGDFNCQSTSWGYSFTDKNGEELENRAERNELNLIHDSKLPSSFSSRRWKNTYNPDNIFVSETLAVQSLKSVEAAIPHTQHRPITCIIKAVIKPEEVPFKRRFNFKKSNWELFTEDLDREILKIPSEIESYDLFVDLVKRISRKHIPRGCRTRYVPGMTKTSEELLQKYHQLFELDPFNEETIKTGKDLLESLAENRRKRWIDLVVRSGR